MHSSEGRLFDFIDEAGAVHPKPRGTVFRAGHAFVPVWHAFVTVYQRVVKWLGTQK
jgi:hypothetical protein